MLWEQEVVSSNLAAPTLSLSATQKESEPLIFWVAHLTFTLFEQGWFWMLGFPWRQGVIELTEFGAESFHVKRSVFHGGCEDFAVFGEIFLKWDQRYD